MEGRHCSGVYKILGILGPHFPRDPFGKMGTPHIFGATCTKSSHSHTPICNITRPPVYKSIKMEVADCHCSQSPTLESNTSEQGQFALFTDTFTTVATLMNIPTIVSAVVN